MFAYVVRRTPTSPTRCVMAAPIKSTLLLAVVLFTFVTGAGTIGAQDAVAPRVTSDAIVTSSDLEALEDRLLGAVYRAEAQHLPPEPYQQTPLIYDGAVVAVEHGGHSFLLTTAAWLVNSTDIVLVTDKDRRIALEITE